MIAELLNLFTGAIYFNLLIVLYNCNIIIDILLVYYKPIAIIKISKQNCI